MKTRIKTTDLNSGESTPETDAKGTRLFTLNEIAELMSCSRKTVENLVADGKMRPVRYLRCVRISAREYETFVRRHTSRNETNHEVN